MKRKIAPMIFLKGFVEIIKQIRGTENIFGYKNTTTNQLFLLYCFCGKIFFTDKIHKSVKYSWIVLHLSGMLLGIVLGIMYVWQDMEKNLWTHLNVLNFVAISIFLGLYIPIGLYYYAEDVEKTIDMIDTLLTSGAINGDDIDVMKIILTKFSFPFVSGVIYMFASIVDVMVFYEEEKLKNYMYYTYPFPNLQNNGNIKFFLGSNIICNLIFGVLLFEWIAAAAFILIWRACCYHGMISISTEIRSKTRSIETKLQMESFGIDAALKQTVINGTKAFKRITSIIDNSRRFIEFLYSIAVLGSFFGEAIQIYVILATEMPFSMKLKGISYLTGLGWTIFLLFWIGETLRSAASTVSFSIYSTPWYLSVNNRQDVQIFLIQTQTLKNLSILNVYPLLCGTFSRYLHGIASYVNFLRNVTKK